MATKPTDRAACPSWCAADHARDGHVHRLEVGRADIGEAVSGERVPVVLLQVPGGETTVTISGGLYVAVQLDDAEDMARLMDMAGQCDMAALIRRAAGILQDDEGDDEGAVATVPGTWPGGEPGSVRAAAEGGGRHAEAAQDLLYLSERGPVLRRRAAEVRQDGQTDVADALTVAGVACDRLRAAVDEGGDLWAAVGDVHKAMAHGVRVARAARMSRDTGDTGDVA